MCEMKRLPRECKKVRERLPEFVEGALGERERARVEQHLASCARCSAELADLRTVLSSLRGVAPDPVPPHLVESIRQAVRRSAPTAREPAYRWARLVVSSAAVGLVLAMALAFHFTQGSGLVDKTAVKKTAKRYERVAKVEEPASVAARHGGEELAFAPSSGPRAETQESAARPGRLAGEEERFGAAPNPAPEKAEKAAPVVSPVCDSEGLSRERSVQRPYRRYCGIRAHGTRQPPAKQTQGGEPGADRSVSASAARKGGPAAYFVGVPKAARAALPVTASVEVSKENGGLSVILTPQGAPVEDLSLAVERAEGVRRVLWSGRLAKTVRVELPGDMLGPGPGTLGLTIQAKGGQKRHALFFPVLSRIGETAPLVPPARYQGEMLGEVLARLSTLSGLVLLAETPLDRPVYGELAGGDPDVVLSGLAADAGMRVKAEGEVVRILALAHDEDPRTDAGE